MGLLRILRSQTAGGIANWSSLLAPFLSVSALGAVLTWAASAWDSIYQHGWGAAVFAGLGALCVVIVVLSIAAVAWRIYRPITPISVAANSTGEIQGIIDAQPQLDEIFDRIRELDGRTQLLLDISSDIKSASATDMASNRENIAAISERLTHIDGLLQPDIKHLTMLARLGNASEPPRNKFDSIEKELLANSGRVEGLKDALTHLIKETNERLEAWKRQSDMHYNILSTSLRARDALSMIKEADAIVLDLGQKLIEAGSYKCDEEWKVDFVSWRGALEKIDQVVGWWSEHRYPILDISGRDIESVGYVAPSHIVTNDDSNRIRYRTVWIAQQSYANRKDGIFAFFESKSGELPG